MLQLNSVVEKHLEYQLKKNMRKYLFLIFLSLIPLTLTSPSRKNVEVRKEFVITNWWDRLLLWLLKRIENEDEKPFSTCSLSLYPPFDDIYM